MQIDPLIFCSIQVEMDGWLQTVMTTILKVFNLQVLLCEMLNNLKIEPLVEEGVYATLLAYQCHNFVNNISSLHVTF